MKRFLNQYTLLGSIILCTNYNKNKIAMNEFHDLMNEWNEVQKNTKAFLKKYI